MITLDKPEAIIGIDKLLALQNLRVKDGLSVQPISTFLNAVGHAAFTQARSLLEADTTKVHFINYDIIRRVNGDVLTYKRPDKKNGEALLSGRRSVGIGGHAEAVDIVYTDKGAIDLVATLATTSAREVGEEVKFQLKGVEGAPKPISAFDNLWEVEEIGFIIEWDKVGMVHLGVSRVYTVSDALEVFSGEDQLEDVKFMTPEAISAQGHDLYEGWSKILLDNYVLSW